MTIECLNTILIILLIVLTCFGIANNVISIRNINKNKEYFESKGMNASDVANGIASIYDNAKDRRRNIYYKVITELIEEIKMLNYGKDKSIIEKLDNIISVNLNELDECKLYNIIKELSEIKYFLQYKENKLKEKGWLKLAKEKTK